MVSYFLGRSGTLPVQPTNACLIGSDERTPTLHSVPNPSSAPLAPTCPRGGVPLGCCSHERTAEPPPCNKELTVYRLQGGLRLGPVRHAASPRNGTVSRAAQIPARAGPIYPVQRSFVPTRAVGARGLEAVLMLCNRCRACCRAVLYSRPWCRFMTKKRREREEDVVKGRNVAAVRGKAEHDQASHL